MMTIGDAIAFLGLCGLAGWALWLSKGWPAPRQFKERP